MIKIEKNKEEYFNRLFEIHNNSFEEKMSKQSFFAEFDQPTRIYFIAVENERPIGYIGALYMIDDLNIIGIAVEPKFRQKGVGTMLLKALKDFGRQKSAKTISLEVNENNTKAINFYKKNGFELTNIRKKYYKDSDAYIMWLYL